MSFAAVCAAAQRSAVDRGAAVLVSLRLPCDEIDDRADNTGTHLPPASRTFHWHSSWSGRSFTAFGSALDLRASGPDRFERLAREVRALVHAGDQPLLVGGFSFSAKENSTHWLGDALFWVPEMCREREADGSTSLTLATMVAPSDDPDEAADRALRWLAPLSQPPDADWPVTALRGDDDTGRQDWNLLVDRALRAIGSNELAKVVTARAVPVSAPRPFDVERVLSRLRERRVPGAVFAVGAEDRWFVGATPECLLARSGVEITTVGLAGSAPRAADPHVDAALGDALFTDAKIRREHDVTTAFLSERIAAHCTEMAVRGPDLIKLPTVQHLCTEIRAQVPAGGPGFLDLVGRLHPTPAVGGTPPEQAIKWLSEHEQLDRGWFAGGVGWLRPDHDGEIGLAIRSAEVAGRTALVYAGCGVVTGSSPDQEWHESRWKMRSMLAALAESVPGAAAEPPASRAVQDGEKASMS